MKPLTRADMDKTGCGIPLCTHDHSVLHIHAACHKSAAVEACYVKATGNITFRCGRCSAFICEVAVATALPLLPRDVN